VAVGARARGAARTDGAPSWRRSRARTDGAEREEEEAEPGAHGRGAEREEEPGRGAGRGGVRPSHGGRGPAEGQRLGAHGPHQRPHQARGVGGRPCQAGGRGRVQEAGHQELPRWVRAGRSRARTGPPGAARQALSPHGRAGPGPVPSARARTWRQALSPSPAPPADPLSPQTGPGCPTTTRRTRGGSCMRRSGPSRAARPSGTTWRSCTR
jgi:hypothetical protein